MTGNIHEGARSAAQIASTEFSLTTGTVTSANPSRNEVIVRAALFDYPQPARVPVDERGDVNVPPVGSPVVVGDREGDLPVVLGTLYGSADVPTVDAGERVIGHTESDTSIRLKPNGDVEISPESDTIVHGGSDTSITLNENGNVELDPENDLVVNGGSTAPVTDVQTTKDADGHITDITLVRANGTKLNSS